MFKVLERGRLFVKMIRSLHQNGLKEILDPQIVHKECLEFNAGLQGVNELFQQQNLEGNNISCLGGD